MESRAQKRIASLMTPIKPEDLVEASFTAVYVQPKKETARHGFMRATQEISYLDLRLAFKIAYAQMERFATFLVQNCSGNTNLNPVRQYVKDVLLPLAPHKENMNFRQLHSLLLVDGGQQAPLFPPLADIVPMFKELSAEPRVHYMFDRYTAAFRGLAMCVATYHTRERLMEKVQNQQPRMAQVVSHPIVERTSKITLGKKETLLEISEMEHLHVLPLVLSTIQNMIDLVEDNENRVKTRDALMLAKRILSDMRDRLEQPFDKQVAEYRIVGGMVLDDLRQFVQCMREIERDEDFRGFSVELSTYLCGMYFQAYNRKDLPLFLPYQQEDKALREATGGKISKFILAEFYERASLAISEVFKPAKQIAPAARVGMTKFAPVNDEADAAPRAQNGSNGPKVKK